MEKIIHKNNKKYYYLCVNDLITLNLMFKKLIYFYNDSNKNKIIGIDFEFEKVTKENKNVSLIQINYEDSSNTGYIFVFDPNTLNTKQLKVFIKFLCSRRIIKIIHGGEALDIPYLFDNLFNKENKVIKKFLRNLYDTKFICQYFNLTKCNIYDLLYEYKVIDTKTINELNKLNDIIGPISNITLNIDTISSNKNFEEYVITDVLYLPKLYYTLRKKYNNELNIIRELTDISYNIKRNVNNYKKINDMNNYYIIIKNDKLNLIDVFYYYFYYELSNNTLIKYMSVTYFNEFIQNIIKFIVYQHIHKKYIIYKSKNIQYDEEILFDNKLLKYPNIKNIIDKIIL